MVITGRRDPELAAAVKEIGNDAIGVPATCRTRPISTASSHKSSAERPGLGVVFANAGVASRPRSGDHRGALYDSIFDINVKGLLFTVQKALPLMPDGASIILNASIVASKGLAANSVYSATKAALRSFARTWSTDLKVRRIRVNAVSPARSTRRG